MSDDLRAALYDCGLAAHFGGQAMDRKTRGGREKLAYIERRAAAALATPEPGPEVDAAWEALYVDIDGAWDDGGPLIERIARHRPRIEAALRHAPDLDVERLARAIEVVALHDRDRVLVGDYTASTYVEHAANLAREYALATPDSP